jgi:AraC family transcriptional regulator, positive regulator of tynA and feaB
MAALERFSTSGLRPRRRVEFWNELCSVYSPLTTQPLDLATFEPSCTRAVAGELSISEISSSPSIVEHSSDHVARTRESLYFFYLQVQGRSIHRQGGREAHLEEGDFTMLSSTQPFQLVFEEPNRILVVALPEERVQREIPCPQDIVAVRMSHEDNLVRMVSQCAMGLWQECAGAGLDAIVTALSRALLHLIGCPYTRLPQMGSRGSTSLDSRRFQILKYIESQLHDSSLSPVTIAARFKQSPRSLHMLFSNAPETLSRYILRRRLEESACALTSPLKQGRSISEIAFDHGFSSSAHFCKVFRGHFHATPTEYRQKRAGAEKDTRGKAAGRLRPQRSSVVCVAEDS